jgi:hypothetical protein
VGISNPGIGIQHGDHREAHGGHREEIQNWTQRSQRDAEIAEKIQKLDVLMKWKPLAASRNLASVGNLELGNRRSEFDTEVTEVNRGHREEIQNWTQRSQRDAEVAEKIQRWVGWGKAWRTPPRSWVRFRGRNLGEAWWGARSLAQHYHC